MLDPLSAKNTPSAEAAQYAMQPQNMNPQEANRKASRKMQALDNEQPISLASFGTSVMMTLLVPCLPVAQIASSVGKPFTQALAIFTALYIAGGAAFAVAGNLEHSFVVAQNPLTVYALEAVMFMCGPFATTAVAFYKFSNAKWTSGVGTVITDVSELDKNLSADLHVNPASVALVVVDILMDIAFAYGILKLRTELNRRIKVNTGDDVGCCTTVAVMCCVSCSLFEMIWAVRDASKVPVCHVGAIDELPAYVCDDVEKHTKRGAAPPV